MTTTQSQSDIPADRPLRGRRLTWEEFQRQYPAARTPANDNQCPAHIATTASKYDKAMAR